MYLSSVFVLPCYLVFVWDVCLAPWVAKDFLRPCEIVRIFCLSYFKKFSCFCLFFFSRNFVFVFLLSFLYLHFEKNFVGVFVFIFCSLNLLTWDLVSCVSIGSYPCLWVAQWYYRLALTPETRVLGRVVTVYLYLFVPNGNNAEEKNTTIVCKHFKNFQLVIVLKSSLLIGYIWKIG